MPENQTEPCPRGGCKDFQICPNGQIALKEGCELIGAKPDSKRKKPPKFTP